MDVANAVVRSKVLCAVEFEIAVVFELNEALSEEVDVRHLLYETSSFLSNFKCDDVFVKVESLSSEFSKSDKVGLESLCLGCVVEGVSR